LSVLLGGRGSDLSYPLIFYIAISTLYGFADKMLEDGRGIILSRLRSARLEYPGDSGGT
jgi:hypothetical protein